VAIPHAGHLANMDNPEAFNRVMMAFLAERYPVPA
jgi:pimeloyl-ACP methyl ester carboxylesterase